MSLVLPLAVVSQRGRQLPAKKPHGLELVRFPAQTHPDEMQVVGHQTIGRANQILPRGYVQQHFPKRGVKWWCEPATGARLHREGPKHHRVTLVMMRKKTRQLAFPDEAHARGMRKAGSVVKSRICSMAADRKIAEEI
jgi:hypothetical protein